MLSALPSPPSRSDTANFAARADTWNAALVQFQTEANALALDNLAQGTQATAARDAAIAAWAASTYPTEALAPISRIMHSGAIVKAIIYDTSEDSDGGAWRKRCTDKSWYTEALGFTGIWGGQAASNAAGWAACGSVVGGAYQSTADGKFYAPTSASAQTEIFRGNVREFPEQVAIVAEIARVVIYDLTQPTAPMWMVFKIATGGTAWFQTGTMISNVCIAAINGMLVAGFAGTLAGYEYEISLIKDSAICRTSTGTFAVQGRTSDRNSLGSQSLINSLTIASSVVNDVAITVLDSVPIDPATGLPVPTIAVATAGGVSVIKGDGTVVNSSGTQPHDRVSFTNRGSLSSTYYGHLTESLPVSQLTAGFTWGGNPLVIADATPFSDPTTISSAFFGAACNAIANSNAATAKGLLLQKRGNKASNTMLAGITTAYNSGWMPGDIRGAYLADATAETITGSGELVTNGTFATDTVWVKGTGWAITGGFAVATASSGILYESVAAVVGKAYVVTFAVSGYSAGSLYASVYGAYGPTITANGTYSHTIVAGGGANLGFYATGFSGSISNVSVKLADADRSVKNNGLVLVGSLTKIAVAIGAALVGYSGFSAANYLEAPYSASLDFGTGDFSVMGWFNPTSLALTQCLFHRAVTSGGILCHMTVTGAVILYATASTTFTAIVTTAAGVVIANTNQLIEFGRLNGTAYIRVNSVTVASAADTTNLTYASAVSRIGYRVSGADPVVGSMALWRITATPPSADEIAHIYRTELPLFQPGAQCTIAGTSTAVTALAYDDTSDTLHVGTSWGRTSFRDLLRIDSESTTTGALTSLSANQGAVLAGGASAGRIYQPALLLRDELRRRDEARKALGKVPVFFDFDTASFTSPTTSGSAALTASSIVGTPYVGMGITGTGIPAGTTIIKIVGTAYTMSANATVTNAGAVAIAQASYTLQQGYTTKAVYSAGALKRLGSTKDYLTASDGYRETVNFGTSPGSAVWVSVMAVRA